MLQFAINLNERFNMKIKVQEAQGSMLDLLVAKCIANVHFDETLNGTVMVGWWISGLFEDKNYWVRDDEFCPSTSWSQGGPIIEREGLSARFDPKDARGAWYAVLGKHRFLSPDFEGSGPTPLIAAMRCFVTSKLGDEVEVPDNFPV